MTTGSPHSIPPCTYKFSYSHTWTLTGLRYHLRMRTHVRAHTHSLARTDRPFLLTLARSGVGTNTKCLHSASTYLNRPTDNTHRLGRERSSCSKIHEVKSFAGSSKRKLKYKTEVHDSQSPRQISPLPPSLLCTPTNTHWLVPPIAKTAKAATSGVIYSLMFFPWRHNGNGRIKEAVNNSRKREWTH